MRKSLSFLRELKKNNRKEWFHANRASYDEARAEFIALIEILVSEIRVFDTELGPVNPKSTLFRINRDIRFTNDKSPYKTNFGAFIMQGGRKSGHAGYYFHLEPGEAFIGGGVYHPSPDVLKALRNEIYGNPEEFRDIIQGKIFYDYFGDMYDDQLKTAPKGYPKDFEYIDLLKYKSYIVSRQFDEKLIVGDGLLQETLKAYRLMYPLVRFINYALDSTISHK